MPYEELQAAAKEQMAIAELRLGNLFGLSAELELQRRTQKRADQVLNQLAATHSSAPLRSPITCHVLDSAMGVPARGLPLSLLKLEEHSRMWVTLSRGVTNEDGRVGNLLQPSNFLAPGRQVIESLFVRESTDGVLFCNRYRMHFDTSTYLQACKQKHPNYYSEIPFYPEVRSG